MLHFELKYFLLYYHINCTIITYFNHNNSKGPGYMKSETSAKFTTKPSRRSMS